MRFIDRFGQTEIDNLHCPNAVPVEMNHDVAGFDIAVNQVLLIDRSQTRSDLAGDFQGQQRLNRAGAFDEAFDRYPLYKLHRIKDFALTGTKMINGGNVWMPNTRSRSRLPEKTPARQLFLKQLEIQNL